ncbi:PEP/pyruvate-binding domain-containing protein [Streptomyces sp. BK205]|uniref:PEP/pyruvate-binding domain-containing protein n=1 Tax=Streptomyces sp. BK205 TaxID=2512164 RepID=UPI0010D5095C|nr:PEP/pyruvate-binding domain-containing protein [Streptomyces sp. BK205]TCR16033.1 pyruvate,water dikinase [Streptomyces sp. BK205]
MTPDLWTPLAKASDFVASGGKAVRLGEMIRLGLPVPDGGVVGSDTARRGLGAAEARQLLAWLRQAGHGPGQRFAVRSSAAAEDSRRASFAGQYLSVLDVARDDVPDAVVQVQRSVAGRSAARYAQRLGVEVPDALAVVVQEQIWPVRSGVCFTVHPVTGAAEVVVECAHGLGDALAGGREMPAETAVFPRTALRAEGLLGEVAELALRVEKLLADGPQDIEWAVDERGLWLLQCRPVTTTCRSSKER